MIRRKITLKMGKFNLLNNCLLCVLRHAESPYITCPEKNKKQISNQLKWYMNTKKNS